METPVPVPAEVLGKVEMDESPPVVLLPPLQHVNPEDHEASLPTLCSSSARSPSTASSKTTKMLRRDRERECLVSPRSPVAFTRRNPLTTISNQIEKSTKQNNANPTSEFKGDKPIQPSRDFLPSTTSITNSDSRNSSITQLTPVRLTYEDDVATPAFDASSNDPPNKKRCLSQPLYESPHIPKERFEFLRVLGRGRFGVVWLAKEKATQLLFAIKQINKQMVQSLQTEHEILNEIEIQSNLRHVNLLRLYGMFHDDEALYLILEYCCYGDVGTLIRNHIQNQQLQQQQPTTAFPLSQPFAAWCVRSVLRGVQYLHSKHVIHRDLKPENLLLDHRGILKVADFGGSVHSSSLRCTSLWGTLDYLAPEQIPDDTYSTSTSTPTRPQRPQQYDEKCDVWAVGVLCFELLAGRPPFHEEEDEDGGGGGGFTATTSNIVCLNFAFPEDFPPLAQDFITQILVLDPKQRASATQLLQHSWIQIYADLFDAAKALPAMCE